MSITSHVLINMLIIMTFSSILAEDNVAFDSLRKSLVVIETEQSTGSGFVLQMNGKKYVFTNYHVIRNSKKISLRLVDGQQLNPITLELADNLDLARIGLDESETLTAPLKLTQSDPTINNPVKIYGNSEGRGAVTELIGKVLGVGPDTIEVDATFVQGNSGSPIIMQDGAVIGVATYVVSGKLGQDWVTSGTRFDQTRRFGVRISPSIKWINVAPKKLQEQTAILDDIHRHLLNVYSLVLCWDSRSSSQTIREALIAYANNQKTVVFEETPWESDIRLFASSYRDFWQYKNKTQPRRGIAVSPQSTSLLLAKNKMTRTLTELPSKPMSVLAATTWATKTLEQEAEVQKSNVTFLNQTIDILLKPESPFWKVNMLNHY